MYFDLQEDGPHIYQTCPSANYYDCKAMAVGARSQSARTYLERHLEEFLSVTRDELIRHALRALRDTLPNDVELTNKVFTYYSHVLLCVTALSSFFFSYLLSLPTSISLSSAFSYFFPPSLSIHLVYICLLFFHHLPSPTLSFSLGNFL